MTHVSFSVSSQLRAALSSPAMAVRERGWAVCGGFLLRGVESSTGEGQRLLVLLHWVHWFSLRLCWCGPGRSRGWRGTVSLWGTGGSEALGLREDNLLLCLRRDGG